MKFIKHLEGLISSRLEIAKGIWQLFVLEAKLAKLTCASLLINLAVLPILIFTSWLAAMVFIGYAITWLSGGHAMLGISIVLLLNLGLLAFIIKRLLKNLHDVSFPNTRACLTTTEIREDNEKAPIKDINNKHSLESAEPSTAVSQS